MCALSFDEIREDLKCRLKPTRYDHTISVMFTAASLAMCYHEDVSNALTAGLLHDCTKSLSNEEHLRLVERESAPLSDSERAKEKLLHAVTGPIYARDVYGCSDPDILNAIRFHTTGRAGMSMLEKIIYIADYIEPLRQPLPNIENVRQLAFDDIDQCVAKVSAACLDYLKQINSVIEPKTIETYEYYSKKEENECQN